MEKNSIVRRKIEKKSNPMVERSIVLSLHI